jgi:transposase-like protein
MKKQRKYDREFKINAIKLCRESGRKLEEVARNLGIPKATLYHWVKEYKEHGERSFPGAGQLKPCNKEVYRLKRQLADVTAETFFHTLKTEEVHLSYYRTREKAELAIFEYVEVFYNRQRLHSTLGYKSPLKYEKRWERQQK